ncbi:hypothetical protein PMAA_008990 [Talaromyces marneffei ATCC 18224]|uniref:F-box domain-containing protein n=1 Tax=Talaromyces marneffei (strain ATCC 18224 / CBS 334.59 / QM 7333) TaxID=441960 RepID=B6QUF5_TALMQ|nr:hypothetical protein PMAA_008990 [Talaromyces marneffei ATCC 18224]
MAALWNLPTEIVIQMMKHSANLSCLWSLINVSSRFKLILMTHAWDIIENVITKTTPSCIRALMRIVIATRTSPDLFIGVSDVAAYLLKRKVITRDTDKVSDRLMLQNKSPQVLHDFVKLAHTIHGVAHACLDLYMERNYQTILKMLYSERQSPGRPFQPKEFGPRTYLEEQIVIRAIW